MKKLRTMPIKKAEHALSFFKTIVDSGINILHLPL